MTLPLAAGTDRVETFWGNASPATTDPRVVPVPITIPPWTQEARAVDVATIKILLVEDNVSIRDMVSRRLAKRGFAVVTAGDGDEACRLAVAEHPDVVLMDLHLPVLDGLEATRRLKSAAETRDMPVIALTADAMAGDHEKAMEAGCDSYETKPIDLPLLLDKIEALLQRKAHS